MQNHIVPGQGCFPRVCGDVPARLIKSSTIYLFSPRMRGCSDDFIVSFLDHRVFPAYAGMFPEFDFSAFYHPGFPRVCGDVPQISSHKAR